LLLIAALSSLAGVFSQTTTPATTAAVVATTAPALVCNNPLFLKRAWNGLEIVFTPNQTPAPFPAANATVCTQFAGQNSCCSAHHLAKITQISTIASANLAQAQAVLSQRMAKNNTYTNFIQNCENGGVSAANCTAIAADFGKLRNLQLAFDSAALTCISAMEKYAVGMLCFACTTNFNKLLTTNPQGAVTALLMKNSTCSFLTNACAPVNTAFISLAQELVTLELLEAKASKNPFANFVAGLLAQEATNLPDLCGGTVNAPGNCTHAICDQWVGGLDNNFPTPAQSQAFRVRNLLGLSKEEMTSNIVGMIHSIGESSARHLQNGNGNGNNGGNNAQVTNVYGADGYDPTSSGSAGTASPVSVAAVVCGVLAGVAVLGAVGFLLYRRKSAHSARV